MTALSNTIKNGQITNVPAGYAAIAANSLVEIGGPGNEAWPVATTDYAVIGAVPIVPETKFSSYYVEYGSYIPMARDRAGNVYTLFPGAGNAQGLQVNKTPPADGSVTLTAQLSGATYFTSALAQLSNGTFVAAYNATNTYFTIFDAGLNILAGPINIGLAYSPSPANYQLFGLCALSGGGFAIAFQSSAGTSVQFATYTNAGVQIVAPTNIQTLAGGTVVSLAMAQLSSGNIVVAFNGTATAGGTAGINHVVVTVGGAAVAGPTNTASSSAAAGQLVQIATMTGFYSVAGAHGTTATSGVYSNAGAVQGTPANITIGGSASVAPKFKVLSDGIQFWFLGLSSPSIVCSRISTAGVVLATNSSIGGSTATYLNYNMDAALVNDVIIVLLVPCYGHSLSSPTYASWLSIGLADASLGVVGPYQRKGITAFGAVNYNGTDCVALGCLSGGGGLYTGTSPPTGHPATPSVVGDYTALFAYDNQGSQGTYFAASKVESTAVVGVGQPALAQGFSGLAYSVNAGPGSYSANPVAGTNGLYFNNAYSTPSGGIGTIYNDGIDIGRDPNVISGLLPGTATLPSNGGAFKSSIILFDTKPGTRNFTVPAGVTRIRPFICGGGASEGGGGGGYSEIVLTVKPGQVYAYTVGNSGSPAGQTSAFGGILSATGGNYNGGVGGAGSGGSINTSGGTGNASGGGGAAGNRFGDGFSAVGLAGAGWSSAGYLVGGSNCIDGWGLGLLPGVPASYSVLASSGSGYGVGIAVTPSGYGCGGSAENSGTGVSGPGGPGGGGGGGGTLGAPAGIAGGGGYGASGAGSGGVGFVGVEILG